MIQLPPMTIKTWRGTLSERFRHTDMMRIYDNLHVVERFMGQTQTGFKPVTRASQFDYSETQKLENRIQQLADMRHVPVRMETGWGTNRPVSFADFERIERSFYDLYRNLGGRAERVPWDEELNVADTVLLADKWQGNGPYTYDLEIPMYRATDDALAYVREDAPIEVRMEEYNAQMTVGSSADGTLRVVANRKKPKHDIPIRISMSMMPMHDTVILPASAWTGSNPSEQTITLSHPIATGLITTYEGMSPDEVSAFARAGISIARVNGNEITVRAMYERPETSLNALVLYASGVGV